MENIGQASMDVDNGTPIMAQQMQYMMDQVEQLRLELAQTQTEAHAARELLERNRENRKAAGTRESTTGHTTYVGSAVKVAKPDKYFGARDPVVIDSWIRRMEGYLAMTGTKDEIKTEIASGYLQGTAFLWYQSAEKEWGKLPGTYVSWQTFSTALRANFQLPNAEMKYWMEWHRLKQTTSVSIYIARFKTIRMVLPIEDNVAMDKFINGLKFETQMRVRLQEPTTLEDAMRIADKYDTLRNQYQRTEINNNGSFLGRSTAKNGKYRNTAGSWKPTFMTNGYEDNRGTPMELDAFFSQNSTPTRFNNSNTSRQSNSNNRSTMVCFYCGKQGHIQKDCRKAKYDSERKQMVKNQKTQ
jgi:Ty3 transposon capsid-like protein/Zinc knuckle